MQSNSPAIDRGENDWLPANITTDSNSNPRIVGGSIDMGAHEAYGLKIGQTVTPVTVAPGAAITYTLHYQNHQDNSSVTNIQLSYQVPEEVVINDVKTEGVALIQVGHPPHYIWELEDLAPQARGTIILSGNVDPAMAPYSSFTTTAKLAVATGDPILDDNTVDVLGMGIDTIYVDGRKTAGANDGTSWADAFTNLQSALNIAQMGDQVWVAQGVYVPSKRLEVDDPRSVTFNIVDGVDLYGGFAGTSGQEGDLSTRDWQSYPTVLSGDIEGNDHVDARGVLTTSEHLVGGNAYHVLMADRVSEKTSLIGFIITAGDASGSNTSDYGGGLSNKYANPTLSNIIFSANSATNEGGGMYNYGSSPSLNNVFFFANAAKRGGGIYNIVKSSPLFTNVSFTGNSAGLNGGGMYNDNSSPTLTNVSFTGNSASRSGGGMENHFSSPTLTNVIFAANLAGSNSGVHNERNSSNLTNIIFAANLEGSSNGVHSESSSPNPNEVNSPTVFWGDGGGMYNHSKSSPNLTNTAFIANTAGRYGGGMYNFEKSEGILNNVTFVANVAGEVGGAIVYGRGELTIHNGIFWNNPPTSFGWDYVSILTISDSIVPGGCLQGAKCIGHLVNANPRFMRLPDPGDGDWATPDDNDYGDLRLQLDSPAIDAGNKIWLPTDTYDLDDDGDTSELIPFDLQSFPRIVNDAVDMGTYEYISLTESLWLPAILR